MNSKIVPLADFKPRKNVTRVLVGGCFDILHIGHAKFLQEAEKIWKKKKKWRFFVGAVVLKQKKKWFTNVFVEHQQPRYYVKLRNNFNKESLCIRIKNHEL